MIKVEEVKASNSFLESLASRSMEPMTRITVTGKWSMFVTVWKDESLTISVVKDGVVICTSTYQGEKE